MKFKKITHLLGCALALGGILAQGVAVGAQPCPWQGTENSAACAQWDLMARRLEAAEARADAAEQALQSMEQALQSMEQALQNMTAQQPAFTTPGQATPPQTESTAAAPALATSESESQARALIDKALGQLEASLAYQPGRLIFSKDYVLQPDGDGYRAEFAEFAFEIEDVRVDLAPVVAYLEAQGPGRTVMAVHFGETLRISEGEDTIATVSLGSQTAAGIWSEDINNFTDFELDYTDIKVSVADEPGALSIGRLGGTQQFAVDASDQWQQQQSLFVESLQFDSGEGEAFNLAGLSWDISAAGQQYSKLLNMSQDIQKLVQDNIDAEQPPTALFDYLKELLGTFQQYQMHLTARGLDILEGGAPIAQIGEITLSNSLDSTRESGGSFAFMVGLNQLASPMAPLPPDLMPQQVRAEIALLNIPPNLLGKFIEMGMESEQISEEQQDAYWQQQLLGLLMSSQLELRIIDTYIAAESARADMNLRAAVDATSAMGGVGELSLRVVGMQTLIDMTGAQQNESVAPVLAMITAFSNRTEENGKTVDSFDLKFAQDGKLFLNDKDVTAMFMPGAAPQ